MIRLLFKLGLFLPLLLVMVWVNWSLDPALVVEKHRIDPSRHQYEPVIARDLLAGRSHRYRAPYSAFVLDELIFSGRPQIKSLVFGSSVGTPIHEVPFSGSAFFNASMFGARIGEMVALYQLALDCGLRPRHVLIEIDARALGQRPPIEFPELLAQASTRLHVPQGAERDSLWMAVWHALVPTGDKPASVNERGPFEPYETLLSPRYFQFSLRFLVRRLMPGSAGSQETPDQFGEPNQILAYPDGSVQWCDNFLTRTPMTVRQRFDEVHTGSFAAEEYRPTPDMCRLCEAFVADLRRSGVDVEFLLLPPNPWFYDRAVDEWKRAGKPLPSVETEARIRSLAANYGIRIRGSLDPRRIGVKEEDYVDEVHLRREAIERLLKTLPAEGGQPVDLGG